MMSEAEQRQVPYLLKLKQTSKVKQLVRQAFSRDDWVKEKAGPPRGDPAVSLRKD